MTAFMPTHVGQLDQTLFSGLPHSASDEQLLLAVQRHPRSLESSTSHDPDASFGLENSGGPLRSSSRAGYRHLKTRLAGVGHDGGFLLSPMLKEIPSRTQTPIAQPDITVDVSDHLNAERMFTSVSEPLPQTQTFADFFVDGPSNAFGIGIPGFSGTDETFLSTNGYSFLNEPPPARMSRARSEAPTWHQQPDHSFLSPPPKPIRQPGSAPSKLDSMTNRMKFTAGTGLGAGPTLESRPVKRIPSRSLARMRSCSSMRTASPPPEEILTPVSGTSMDQQQHLNSGHGVQIHVPVPTKGPAMSFSELYNVGLGVEAVEYEQSNKTSALAQELLQQMEPRLHNYTTQPAPDMSSLNSLSTSQFGHESAFSSPASVYLSDHQAQSHLSPAAQLSPTTHSPHSRVQSPIDPVDYEESLAQSLGSPPVIAAGRQACLPYAAKNLGQHGFSANGVPTRFAYPTRWMNQFSPNDVSPASFGMVSNPSQASTLSSVSTYSTVSSAHSAPPLQPMPETNGSYERNLEMFNGQYARADYLHTPKAKRTRHRSACEDEYSEGEDDDGDEYVPGMSSPPLNQPRKRLRTVASAPCLPARRLKPGPKPKKSPATEHQAVFHNATLSPPMPQCRRGTSPFSDDEGRPASSVPKSVIESFYELIPGYIASNGEKISKRYACLMQGCEKSFPRKSAIESHIQTHLEDKPYICSYPECEASFVRQHDLRRHERIHSGNKPFPCPCGKGFARGDALARHRARGICSGSLVPRKN